MGRLASLGTGSQPHKYRREHPALWYVYVKWRSVVISCSAAPAVQSPADALILSLSLNCWLLIPLIWASVQPCLLQRLHCLWLQGHSTFLRSWGSLAGASEGSAEWDATTSHACAAEDGLGDRRYGRTLASCAGRKQESTLSLELGRGCTSQGHPLSLLAASLLVNGFQARKPNKSWKKDFFEESWLFLSKARL